MISVLLDGTLLRQTPDLGDLAEIIELDGDIKTWVQRFDDVKLVFVGDGYNYIKLKKDQNGYNYRINVEIRITDSDFGGGSGDSIRGWINLTDIKIDHTTQTIEASLVEYFFEGAIKQNIKVESYLREVWKSINGVDIAAYAGDTIGLRLFNPADGVHDGNHRYGVDLFSAIQFMVKYITDDEVDFRDDYSNINWPSTRFCLIKGRELRLYEHDDADKPQASFYDLITNAYKIFNVWYYIDYSTYKPVFVLDSYDNIFNNQQTSTTLPYMRNIKEEFNQKDFFTDIKIGTKKYIPPAVNPSNPDFPEYLPFISGFTHHEESYHGKNNTTIQQPLNLISDWIMDHNIITKIWNLPDNDEYDDEYFLIECTNVGVVDDEADAFTYGLLEADTERRYNENLLNSNRLARFSLPVDIGFDTGVVNDNFRATLTGDVTGTSIPLPFGTETLDPNNNYDAASYHYTAPTTGNYGFNIRLFFVIDGLLPGYQKKFSIILFQRYTSGTTKTFKVKSVTFTTNTGPEGVEVLFSANMFMASTDTMRAHLIVDIGGNSGSSHTILGTFSEFYTTYVQNQGGLLVNAEANIRNYYGSKLSFEHSIPLSTWKELKNNPIQDIKITKEDDRMAIGKIQSFKRVIKTGKTTCELISNGGRIGL